MSENATRMTLGQHLDELRRCLVRALVGVGIGAAVCLLLRKAIFQVLYWPLAVATGGRPPGLVTLSPPEAFATLLKVCVIVGAILAGPYSLYQLWRFISAGLHESERRAVRRYFLPAVGLFALGVAFFFLVVAPLVMRFFLIFGQENFAVAPTWGVDWYSRHLLGGAPAEVTTQPSGTIPMVRPTWRLTEYVWFVSLLSLVFGLAFQTPLVVMFLGRSGIVAVARMRALRRYVFMIVLVLSAFLTPPDPLSMMALALPMYGLYEVGLLVAGRGRPRPT